MLGSAPWEHLESRRILASKHQTRAAATKKKNQIVWPSACVPRATQGSRTQRSVARATAMAVPVPVPGPGDDDGDGDGDGEARAYNASARDAASCAVYDCLIFAREH